jgi:hypothetical protein
MPSSSRLKGGPAARRAYFDRTLARLQPARATLPPEYAAAIAQRNGISEMSAGEALRIYVKQAMHLAHRVLGGSALIGGVQVLQDGLLRLTRFFLLDRFVHLVVLAAPLWTDAVVLDEGTTHRAGDLDHFLLQERRRANRADRRLVGQLAEEAHDGGHLRHGDDAVVRVAGIAEIVADAAKSSS